MENMENVVMNEEVKTEMSTDVVDASLGKTIAKVVLVGVGIGLAIRGAIGLAKTIEDRIKAKKAKKDDVVVEEFEEVTDEEK